MVIIMGRETMHSSIALLQERFRELQRVKEMREERELLKMMLNSDHQPPNKQYLTSNFINHPATMMTCYYEPPTRLFFHPELIAIPSCKSPSPSPSPPPPPQPPHVYLSLWPTSSSPQQQDDNNKKTSAEVKHCLHGSSWEDWDSNSADSDGVDTTLHL